MLLNFSFALFFQLFSEVIEQGFSYLRSRVMIADKACFVNFYKKVLEH